MMNLWLLKDLALDAAMEIDFQRIGKPNDEFNNRVIELAKELESASKADCLDPIYMGFLIDSIFPREKNRGNHIDQIYLETNLLSKELYHFQDFSEERQIDLIHTCLELSKQAERHYGPIGRRRFLAA